MATKKQIGKPKKTQSKAMVRRERIATGVIAGKTSKQIAEEIGMTENGVVEAKENPQFPATLQALLERNSEKYNSVVGKTFKALDELLDSNIDSTRFKAIDRVLRLIEMQQPKQGLNLAVGVTIEQLEMMVKSE